MSACTNKFELPPECAEPELIELHDYWRRKSPPGKLPGRQHIDPMDFSSRLLPRILLFDVLHEDNGPRFRLRVAGTAYVQFVGREVTGRWYDEIAPPDKTRPMIEALRSIVETRAPLFIEGPLTVAMKEFVWVKRLGLPLARDGETVDMVIGTFYPVTRALESPALPAVRPYRGTN